MSSCSLGIAALLPCVANKTFSTPLYCCLTLSRLECALCACSWILSVFHHFWVFLSNFVCFSSFFNFSDIFGVILTRIFHVFVLFLLIFATFWTVFSHSRDSWENVTKQCKNSTKLEKICPKHEKYESETHWKYKKNRKNEEKHTKFEKNTQKLWKTHKILEHAHSAHSRRESVKYHFSKRFWLF